MSFWDRQVEFAGRVRAKNVDTEEITIFDVSRAEGTVYDEGTILDSDGFDEGLQSYFDVSQEMADALADELDDTGVSLSNVSGSVKYGEIDGMKIVYVKLVATAALAEQAIIARYIPSAYRPSGAIMQGVRSSDRQKIKLTTSGEIIVQQATPIGGQIYTEFAWI